MIKKRNHLLGKTTIKFVIAEWKRGEIPFISLSQIRVIE